MYLYNVDTGTLHIEGYCHTASLNLLISSVLIPKKKHMILWGRKYICVKYARKKET